MRGQSEENRPLAVRMRPSDIRGVVGQRHIMSQGAVIPSILKMDSMPSVILYGPPGCGKTTLAFLLSRHFQNEFIYINAVLSNIKELRHEISRAQSMLKSYGKKTTLFIDELQRFTSVQQEALLPSVENGIISLVGVSVENPMFAVVPALISRSVLIELKRLEEKDIVNALKTALSDGCRSGIKARFCIEENALIRIAKLADGDLRKAYNLLELCINAGKDIDESDVIKLSGKKAVLYDRAKDSHYDNISAFIKAMRAGNEKDAVYWLGKMLYAGEDPRFIARRIVIFASEDIGLALPGAMAIAQSVYESVSKIGMPESRIILSNVTIYMCRARKSRYSYEAIEAVMREIEQEHTKQAPKFLK